MVDLGPVETQDVSVSGLVWYDDNIEWDCHRHIFRNEPSTDGDGTVWLISRVADSVDDRSDVDGLTITRWTSWCIRGLPWRHCHATFIRLWWAAVGALRTTLRKLRGANGSSIDILGCSSCVVSFLGGPGDPICSPDGERRGTATGA